jgi:hypothetical protein
LSKVYVEDAHQSGIKFEDPNPLVSTTGIKWAYQPPPDLYEILATNVLDHYAHYKENEIDKTYIPTYFFLGGAGTGKSRHASEFASSVEKSITLRKEDPLYRTQRPLYHELEQRLKNAFVFHVSFENGTSLDEEENNLWHAVGARMLHQLLKKPIEYINKRFIADPPTVFRLVAAAHNVDLYDDFTGILVVDGIQKAFNETDDGMNKNSAAYRLLGQLGGLGLMSRSASEAKGRRKAPFIMTCVTGTCVGPEYEFLADTHRKRVYLPLNRLEAPLWEESKLPVLPVLDDDSPTIRLLVKDVGGHARALELIADLLTRFKEQGIKPTAIELANGVYSGLTDRYGEAVSMIHRHAHAIVQCALSRQQIHLGDTIPGSNVRWEQITAKGLIWVERTGTEYYNAPGYLVVPYIWLWMLSRLEPSKNTERLRQFLRDWRFNDYAELLYLETGDGSLGNTTWQSFEVFCRSFRILRSLGFEDGQEVPLKLLHSGCKLRDDKETMVVNRYLEPAQAVRRVNTKSMPEKFDTQHSGTLDADAQLSHATLNAAGASAGDFFFKIETSAQRSSSGKDSQGNIVHEIGQCKLIKTKLNQDRYDAERKKSAKPDDIFMLYTKTKMSDDFVLPDRSGLVDASCWDSYFGSFAGRAYLALGPNAEPETSHPL